MAEKVERVESPESKTTVTSVVLDRSQPEYLGHLDDSDRPPAGDADENLVNAHTGYKATLREWRERERLIDINPMLTAVGKADAKQKAVPEFEAKLTPLDQVVASAEKRVAALEKELSHPDLVAVDDAAAATRAMELRQWFSRLERGGPRGQIRVMQEALASNNTELLAALVDANPAMGIVAPEIRTHLIEAIAERHHPEKVSELALRRQRLEIAKFGAQRVREILRGNTPLPMRDRFVRATEDK